MIPMIYLASPYSDPDPAVCERRYQDALQALGEARATLRALSPSDRGAPASEIEEIARKIPDPGLDCRECGLCCAPRGGLRMTINILPAEGARMEAIRPGSTRPYEGEEVRLARKFEADPSLSQDDPDAWGCLFHRPGPEGACSIYADRPDVCREFPPGSRECLKVRTRAQAADSPQIAPPVEEAQDEALPDLLPALLAAMRERPFPLGLIPQFREALLDAALDLDGDDLAWARRVFDLLGEAQVEDVNVRTARFVDALSALARLVHGRSLRAIPSDPKS